MEGTMKEERDGAAAATEAATAQLRAALLSEQRTTESLQREVITLQQQQELGVADTRAAKAAAAELQQQLAMAHRAIEAMASAGGSPALDGQQLPHGGTSSAPAASTAPATAATIVQLHQQIESLQALLASAKVRGHGRGRG